MRPLIAVACALALASCSKPEMKGSALGPAPSAVPSAYAPASASSAPPVASVPRWRTLSEMAKEAAERPEDLAKVIAEANTDGERELLRFTADLELAKRGKLDEKGLKLTRERFARNYEYQLLRAKRNPEEVSVKGTKLRIKCFFCSRQFLFDMFETFGTDMQALGFTVVECESLTHTYTNAVAPKVAK